MQKVVLTMTLLRKFKENSCSSKIQLNIGYYVKGNDILNGWIIDKRNGNLGLISPTFYEQLLRTQIPKAQKRLPGSACAKADEIYT